jgi:hypothetical protein
MAHWYLGASKSNIHAIMASIKFQTAAKDVVVETALHSHAVQGQRAHTFPPAGQQHGEQVVHDCFCGVAACVDAGQVT